MHSCLASRIYIITEQLFGFNDNVIRRYIPVLHHDISIRKHLSETVFPGIGGEDSVVELTVDELEKLADPVCWVAVTK